MVRQSLLGKREQELLIDSCKTYALDTEQDLADVQMHARTYIHAWQQLQSISHSVSSASHTTIPLRGNDSDSSHEKLEGVHSAVIASKVSSPSSLPKSWTWRPGFLWHKGENLMNRTGSITSHSWLLGLVRKNRAATAEAVRAKGTEECRHSKGRQRWYQAISLHWRPWWAPHFHMVTMDLGWTLPDGETHISMEKQGNVQISYLLFLLQLWNLLCISFWLQHIMGVGGFNDLFTNNVSREVSYHHLVWLFCINRAIWFHPILSV